MYATIDIETTGLNRYTDSITYIGIGLAHDVGEPIFKGYILDMSKRESIEKFKNICAKLKSKKAKTVFQNGKFDTLFIEVKYGIKLPISEDIMLMGTAYDLAEEHGLKNVAFLRTRIEFIESLFAPGEVAEIWITFADPQIGREKKRLTSPLFMNRYRNFLKEGGIVHLKTDSRYLHEYSKAMAQQNSLEILACATDIYGEDRERLYQSGLSSLCGRSAVDALFEVQTFYESQYLAQGFPITYLSFIADHQGAYISPEWDEDTWKDENHHFVIPSGLAVASKFYPEG